MARREKTGFELLVWLIWVPMIAIMIVCAVMLAFGYGAMAAVLSPTVTLAWLVGVLVWAAVSHSKKRWPEASTFTRLSRVLTFYRG